MKNQTPQEALMQLIKNNLREIANGRTTDSYSMYIAELTLRKILESEQAK